MNYSISNNAPVIISSGNPSIIISEIEVSGVEGNIHDVNVSIDADHTWTADLEISIEAPSGDRVLLVANEGGDGDHFRMTIFDDAATQSIFSATAPFTGVFQPSENLSLFNNQDPNGVWILHVEDHEYQDGGTLNSWSLNIESCCNTFENRIPFIIDAGSPNKIHSSIEITSLSGLLIGDIVVTVDVAHTWDDDLTIVLISPDGHRVVLADRVGGDQNDFNNTIFDDGAESSITVASAPFRGRFQPVEPLSAFENKLANGIWTLEVEDRANKDGGELKSWSVHVMTKNAELPSESEFTIEVRFLGGLTANQRAVFELAAARWSEIVIGDLPSVEHDNEIIDDLIIDAQGTAIDGRAGVLGQAGPTILRSGSLLPARGLMSFDTADLANMEAEGTLVDVIAHEMCHVLGLGTLWGDMGYLDGAGTVNPTFTGPNAMQEYKALTGASSPTPVPVANTGGGGTRDGHWRESVLGNELMTGFVEAVDNPISRLTIASLEDLGYMVNYDAADAYVLPSALRLAEIGISALRVVDHGGNGIMFFPDREVLPPGAFVD
jgi:subtilisin-like proprotein convertase family protein